MVFRILTKIVDRHTVLIVPDFSIDMHGVSGDPRTPLRINFNGGGLDTDREFRGMVVEDASHPHHDEPLTPVVDEYLLRHDKCGIYFDLESKVVAMQAKAMHLSPQTTEVMDTVGRLVEEGFTIDEVLTYIRDMGAKTVSRAKATRKKSEEKELANA